MKGKQMRQLLSNSSTFQCLALLKRVTRNYCLSLVLTLLPVDRAHMLGDSNVKQRRCDVSSET